MIRYTLAELPSPNFRVGAVQPLPVFNSWEAAIKFRAKELFDPRGERYWIDSYED